jgi:hypothetical protein
MSAGINRETAETAEKYAILFGTAGEKRNSSAVSAVSL